MSLPERMYYPILEAAEKLGCSQSDILHYASVGVFNLSVYVDLKCDVNSRLVYINLPRDRFDDIDDFQCIDGDKWSIGDIDFIVSNGNDNVISGYYSGRLFGFFYVHSTEVLRAEFSQNDDVQLSFLTTNPSNYDGQDIEISLLRDGGEVFKKANLCLMLNEFNKISSGVSGDYPKSVHPETDKTIAKKAELIPALLKMVPELSNVDFESTPVKKIIELIEAVAASKGVCLPETHRQTWQKYLGRK
ncbi:hypothetical protein [Serratia marcescens]|uniref:hypothetical protein n=1 Tax=Serratia marcescens TaxID=615 RepID=UPI001495C73E|nr:hypothetical protein [Serratia marcescens]MDP8607190.1 hypothetical protein [Serratia marcescens]MDP8875818.1 hypothetical protein [Serratia marcescens]